MPQASLYDLPDELWTACFRFGALAQLHALQRVCTHFKMLVRTTASLWTLSEATYNRGLGSREAYECVHAVRSRHMLRMLAGEVEARNDERRNGWPSIFHSADPLAGRNDADRFLFETLCDAAMRAPLAGPQQIDALQQIALVLEIRRGTPQVAGPEDGGAKETHTWVLPASDDNERDDGVMAGLRHHFKWGLARLSINTADEAGLLSFGRDNFIVLWAVHRTTKAVALLHAAEPCGDQVGIVSDHNYLEWGVRGSADVDNVMHAASNVPRVAPAACVKVDEFSDGISPEHPNAHREVATLAAHVNLRPVWERSGCSGAEVLMHPDCEELEYTDQHGVVHSADYHADAWWVAHVEIDLDLEGSETIEGQPTRPHVDLSESAYFEQEQQDAVEDRDALRLLRRWRTRQLHEAYGRGSAYHEAMSRWYHAALLEHLRSSVIWVLPKALEQLTHHTGRPHELENRVHAFLGYVMGSHDSVEDGEEYELGQGDGGEGQGGDGGGDE